MALLPITREVRIWHTITGRVGILGDEGEQRREEQTIVYMRMHMLMRDMLFG